MSVARLDRGRIVERGDLFRRYPDRVAEGVVTQRPPP
jgi:hypothetical protein